MRLVDADAEVERLKKDYCEECTRKGNYGIFGAACTPCWVMDAVEEFENAPTIEPEVRDGWWIPCSERMPEDLQTVIAVWVNHKPKPYYSEIKDKPFTSPCIYYNGEWFWWSSCCKDYLAEYGRADFDKIDDAVEITHWMPLPQPPKTEED